MCDGGYVLLCVCPYMCVCVYQCLISHCEGVQESPHNWLTGVCWCFMQTHEFCDG